MSSGFSQERPLNRSARIVLVLSAAFTIILFYLFVALAALFLLVWIGLELIVAIALARFGLAGLISSDIGRNILLVRLLVGSLWLKHRTNFRVVLDKAKAPGVFAISEALAARLNIPPPDKIYIELGAGAWVELRGLKQKIGRTHVGLGYDLLAGLNTKEIEAVLAHELAHAKLVNRNLKRWLNFGLSRSVKLANHLAATVDAARQQKKEFFIAEQLFAVSDNFTRVCVRLIATYSRQDEFDADRCAAELCGPGSLRTSLLKLDSLEPKLARLPWNERMAQIQSDDGLSRWLVNELSVDLESNRTPVAKISVANPYSTHPSTTDRLAALTDLPETHMADLPSGITLLADADEIARELAGEVERKMLVEENKDKDAMRVWLRRTRRRANLRLADWPAVIGGIGTVVVAIVAIAESTWQAATAIFVVGSVFTYVLHRAFRYRDRNALPVPDYALLFSGKKIAKEEGTIEERQKAIEKSFEERLAGTPSKRRNAILLATEAYQALAESDYLRAHVAARFCLQRNETLIEGLLALAVASAALGQSERSQSLLNNLLQKTTLRSRSARWGAAWALALLGEWMPAEALLHELIRIEENRTFIGLLACCQHRRGKLRSAITNARKSVGDSTAGAADQRLLIRVLLDHGSLLEADEQLTRCAAAAQTDQELQFSWLRLRLLQRRFVDAEPWVQRIDSGDTAAGVLVALGGLFETAREDAKAAEYFERARVQGHNPDAYIGLGRLAARNCEEDKATELAKAAIDLTKTSNQDSRPAIAVFPEALGLVASFRERVQGGKAWVATLPNSKTIGSFSSHKLLIYAPSEQEARAYLEEILAAFLPGVIPSEPLHYGLDLAPSQFQPIGPVRPGVQRFFC